MLANSSMKELIKLLTFSYLELIFPPKFMKKAAKIFPFTFSMEHLFHRLYGVDVPGSSM